MALPAIMRRLFAGDGYGPLLKDDVVSKRISIQDWSGSFDYQPATAVRGSDGRPYWSVAASGPNSGGAANPVSDDGSHWAALPSMADIAALNYATQDSVAGQVQAAKIWVTDQNYAPTPWVTAQDYASKQWVGDQGYATQQWANNKFVSVSYADTFYVDYYNGDDSNDGLTKSTAKKSIVAAQNAGLTKSLSTYFRIIIGPGIYNESLGALYGKTVEYVGDIVNDNRPVVNRVLSFTNSTLILNGYFQVKKDISADTGGVIVFNNYANIQFPNIGTTKFVISTARNGLISITENAGVNFSFIGTPGTVSLATICSVDSGVFSNAGSMVWGGVVSGRPYYIARCSVISGAGTPTVIAGNAEPFVDSTSSYN